MINYKIPNILIAGKETRKPCFVYAAIQTTKELTILNIAKKCGYKQMSRGLTSWKTLCSAIEFICDAGLIEFEKPVREYAVDEPLKIVKEKYLEGNYTLIPLFDLDKISENERPFIVFAVYMHIRKHISRVRDFTKPQAYFYKSKNISADTGVGCNNVIKALNILCKSGLLIKATPEEFNITKFDFPNCYFLHDHYDEAIRNKAFNAIQRHNHYKVVKFNNIERARARKASHDTESDQVIDKERQSCDAVGA